MKKLFTVILVFSVSILNATNYYVSTSSGGTNSGTFANPWTSSSSINWASLVAGDSLLFKRGDTFGKIVVGKSGSSGNPIIIAAYGTGNNPVISGFTSLDSWTNISGNIWETTSAATTLSTLNMVVMNGVFQPISRYPKDGGYLSFQTHSGEGAGAVITSNAISLLPSYTDGEVVIRKTNWIIDRYGCAGQTNNTVTLGTWLVPPQGSSDVYNMTNGWGFFFQNSTNACTQHGEWAFKSATKKLDMYSSSGDPGELSVQASTVDTLIDTDAFNYLKFINLTITGANKLGINVQNSTGITIDNCTISYCGINGIYGYATNFTLTNSTLSYINNVGVYPNAASSSTITGNTLAYIGNVSGMGQNSDGQYIGMSYIGASSTIESNVVHDIGYLGIRFHGASCSVRKNYVYNVCTVKNDGAGIYAGALDFSGSVIDSNVVINSIGITAGTTSSNFGQGIYIDDAGSNVTITNNTIADCGDAGLFTNGGTDLTYRGNVVYNCASQFATDNFTGTPSGLSLKKNIFFSFLSSQYCLYANSGVSSSYTNTDSNYYCRPVDDNQIIRVNGTNYTLSGWRTYSGQDAHSLQSPKTVGGSGSGSDSLILVYNPTNHDSTVTLPANYVDVTNTTYNGSITLAPFSSAPLIYLSALPASGNDFKYKKSRLIFGYGDAYEYFFIPETLIKEATKASFILKPFSSKVLIYKSKATGTVLPVSLMNFNTSVSGNVVTVSWSTAQEQNNDHFEIQVSDDGINWKTVKTVHSKAIGGNSSSKLDYSTQIILK